MGENMGNFYKRALLAVLSIVAMVASSLVITAPAEALPALKFLTILKSLPTDNSFHGGYVRSKFKLWVDADGNGCNTRAEVLMAESRAATTHSSTCTIRTGSWISAYDGVRETTASKLDIDHMVPLAEAWRSGAYKWTAAKRQAYANDLGYAYSLIAVSASSNRQKSDSDPAGWLPSVVAYRCTYAASWVAIKYRWRLSVDSAERAALALILRGCKNTPVTLPSLA